MTKPKNYTKIYGHADPYTVLTKEQAFKETHEPRYVRERFRATVPTERPLYYTRIMELPPYGGGIQYESVSGGNFVRGYNTELTVDTLANPRYDKVRFGEPKDMGGSFYSAKISWREHYARQNIVSPPDYYFPAGGRTRIWGSVQALTWSEFDDDLELSGFNVVTSPEPPLVDQTAYGWGAEGWARAKPAKAGLDGILNLQDLIQLKGLRFKEFLREFKDLGAGYLKYEFGWKQTVKDLVDTFDYVAKLQKQIAFIKRNRDKPVRRSRRLHKEDTYRQIGDNLKWPFVGLTATDEVYGGLPRLYDSWDATFMVRKHQRVWFSGEFVYSFQGKDGLPPPDATLRARLLGLELTPSTLWDLAPWTFFHDYLTNIGDIISNWHTEVADDQVSNYAYVMKHTKRTYTWQGTEGYIHGDVSRIFDTKVRDKVNPFGLAGDLDLSPKQLAIIAALGIVLVL